MGSALKKAFRRRNRDEEERRPVSRVANSMQEVAHRIFMGSEKASRDVDALRANNITHIVAVGWDLTQHFPDEFRYLSINKVLDAPQQNILAIFPQCFRFMDEALQGQGCIYVHCHKGLSRSASVIIGYIMYQKKQGFHETWQEIRKKRSFIMPNIGFQEQMVAFEESDWDIERDYDDVDVLDRVARRIPSLLDQVKHAENLGSRGELNELGEHELFDLTMHFHQVYQLNNDIGLSRRDVAQLKEAIQRLRRIQVDFIQNEQSIEHFDKLLFPKLPEFNPKYEAQLLNIESAPSPNNSSSRVDEVDSKNAADSAPDIARQASNASEGSYVDEDDLKEAREYSQSRSKGVRFVVEVPEDVQAHEKREKNYAITALRVSQSTKNIFDETKKLDFDDLGLDESVAEENP